MIKDSKALQFFFNLIVGKNQQKMILEVSKYYVLKTVSNHFESKPIPHHNHEHKPNLSLNADSYFQP